MSEEINRPGSPGESVVLENKKYGLRQEYVYFTPSYVDTVVHNNIRALNEVTVMKYMNQQIGGTFYNDLMHPVCFNSKGEVVDGQHRLTAIQRSGRSYWLPVSRNVEGKRHGVVDTGRSRKMWQNLGIPTKHDAALKVIWKYGLGQDRNPDFAELAENDYMAAYKRFKTIMERLDQVPPPTGKIAYRKAELLGVAARILKYSPEVEGLVSKAITELKSCENQSGLTHNQHVIINRMREYLNSHQSNTEALKAQNVSVLETLFLKLVENEPLKTRVVQNTQKVW